MHICVFVQLVILGGSPPALFVTIQAAQELPAPIRTRTHHFDKHQKKPFDKHSLNIPYTWICLDTEKMTKRAKTTCCTSTNEEIA